MMSSIRGKATDKSPITLHELRTRWKRNSQKNSTSDSINYLSQIESILTKSTVHHRHGIKTQKYKNI